VIDVETTLSDVQDGQNIMIDRVVGAVLWAPAGCRKAVR
jgi:hypothetical protein